MDIEEFVEEISEQLSAGRVFGEPIRLDGKIVLPAAQIRGGGGGGAGDAPSRANSSDDTTPNAEAARTGNGAGFGMMGKPAGALVVDSADVRWVPYVDRNLRLLAAAVVAVFAIRTVRAVLHDVMKAR